MSHAILPPFIPYLDSRGTALQNGKIYFGVSGFIAESVPITVYWDRALTQPAAQPLRTTNGYIVRGGTPANVFFDVADYSVTAKNSQDVTLFNILSALASGFIDQDTATPVSGVASSGNHLQNTNFENNSAQLGMPAVIRAGDAFYDKFIAGAAGLTASIASVNGINTVTISAGSLIQSAVAGVIGPFVLSWEGTAQARINGGAYHASPVYLTAGSTVAVIECEWSTGTVSKINLNYSSTPEQWVPGINYYLFQHEPKNNLVYNGDMVINQSGAGLVTTNGAYICDGFIAGIGLASGQAQKMSQLVPYSLAGRYIDDCVHTSTSAGVASFAAGEFLYMMQKIEGFKTREIVDQPGGIRFFARAKTPGVYSLAFRNGAGTQSYVLEYNIPSADTWTIIEKNIPQFPPTSITNILNGSSLEIIFTVDSGVNFKTATLNAWLAGNYFASNNQAHGATVINEGLKITGIEFFNGNVESSKVMLRNYEEELELCRRYYRKYEDLFMCGYGAASDIFSLDMPIDPEMRAAPTVTYANVTVTNAVNLTALNVKTNHAAHYITIVALGHGRCDFDAILDARL